MLKSVFWTDPGKTMVSLVNVGVFLKLVSESFFASNAEPKSILTFARLVNHSRTNIEESYNLRLSGLYSLNHFYHLLFNVLEQYICSTYIISPGYFGDFPRTDFVKPPHKKEPENLSSRKTISNPTRIRSFSDRNCPFSESQIKRRATNVPGRN